MGIFVLEMKLFIKTITVLLFAVISSQTAFAGDESRPNNGSRKGIFAFLAGKDKETQTPDVAEIAERPAPPLRTVSHDGCKPKRAVVTKSTPAPVLEVRHVYHSPKVVYCQPEVIVVVRAQRVPIYVPEPARTAGCQHCASGRHCERHPRELWCREQQAVHRDRHEVIVSMPQAPPKTSRGGIYVAGGDCVAVFLVR